MNTLALAVAIACTGASIGLATSFWLAVHSTDIGPVDLARFDDTLFDH